MSEAPQKIRRIHVKAIDDILGDVIPVLDDGFVRVVDYMGDDASVVQAARVSYGSGTKRVHEDRGLIRYLLRHSHTTPFEMCELKLHVRVPMDTWRQWIRHRTANVNEYSTRYSIAIDAAQRTPPEQWRLQGPSNRQGSDGYLNPVTGQSLSQREREAQDLTRAQYEERIGAGVAREQARKDLPLSTYTEAYWKIDLHNLLHFLRLRMDSDAQWEIRQYANVIANKIVAQWCPLVWDAFNDYKVNSISLSRFEVEILRSLLLGDADTVCRLAQERGWVGDDGKHLPKNRERQELELKSQRLGIVWPWDPKRNDI